MACDGRLLEKVLGWSVVRWGDLALRDGDVLNFVLWFDFGVGWIGLGWG